MTAGVTTAVMTVRAGMTAGMTAGEAIAAEVEIAAMNPGNRGHHKVKDPDSPEQI
jgi:uncharacterized protein YoaH (UPF0181 family)